MERKAFMVKKESSTFCVVFELSFMKQWDIMNKIYERGSQHFHLGIAFNCSFKIFVTESNVTLFLWVQCFLHLVGPHLEWKLQARKRTISKKIYIAYCLKYTILAMWAPIWFQVNQIHTSLEIFMRTQN